MDHDVNNVERNAFPYGQTFVAAETNRAAASSLRLLAAVAMTAEDDASRADIAIEPGVLGVVQALLNEERPEREVREERGRSRCLVLAGACRLSAELARTPAALAAARAETEMADVEGSAFLGGLLRALDTSSSVIENAPEIASTIKVMRAARVRRGRPPRSSDSALASPGTS